MKIISRSKYGGPEVLKLEEGEKPKVKNGHILVKVKANSINPVDDHFLRGKPLIMRVFLGLFKPPKKLGSDFAGIVEEVGINVTNFNKGDRVYGSSFKEGAFAEYITVPENVCAKMPSKASFAEMAAVPIAGISALQSLTKLGNLKKGQSVFINGASGGVGHFAVQLAKELGAKVTAVCSKEKEIFVKSLGADEVICYDQQDIHSYDVEHYLILDVKGNLNHKDHRRIGKRSVMIGFKNTRHVLSTKINLSISKNKLHILRADVNTADLDKLSSFIDKETLKIHLGKTYKTDEVSDAMHQIETGHTKGKVALEWD